jgi:hypothetical protein
MFYDLKDPKIRLQNSYIKINLDNVKIIVTTPCMHRRRHRQISIFYVKKIVISNKLLLFSHSKIDIFYKPINSRSRDICRYSCLYVKVGVFLVGHKPPQIWNGFWPSSSALRGHRRTYLTILERACSANFKMVWYVLLRPLRPELNGQDPFQICGGLFQTRKTPTLV